MTKKQQKGAVIRLIGSITLLLISSLGYTSSLYVGADSYQYDTDIDNIALDYRLTGLALGGSLDIGESIVLQLGIGEWRDDIGLEGMGDSDIRSTLQSIGIGYTYGNWRFFASYRRIEDELDVIHGRDLEFFTTSDIQSTLFDIDASYRWKTDMWAHTVLLGLQNDDKEVDTNLDQPSTKLSEQYDTRYAYARFSTDYYYSLSNASGLYFGGSIDWYNKLSGGPEDQNPDQNAGGPPPPPPPPGGGGGGRGGGGRRGGGSGSVSSGDNGGTLELYFAYDIDTHWSADLNASIATFGDADGKTYSLTLTYRF